jgi:predicted transcriptional regulator of viral defense system
MGAYTPHAENALKIARSRGIARARDFRAAGIPAVYLDRLCKQGQLVRLARGLYQLPENSGTDAAHNLAEAARLMPHGVISLLSALRLHGLTTQLPHAVWITLRHKSRAPIAPPFSLEIVRATGPAFSAGIEHVEIESVSVPVYNAAKTIADCFKHRRRVGLDIAVEALRDALRQRKATPADLWRYATMNRVSNTMRPYLEALT